MKKTLIIFGNITFDEIIDSTPCAIIHEVQDTLLVPEIYAEQVGDELVNIFTSYIIPSKFEGKIIWE